MISGSFSIVRQAINLGVFPPLEVRHTGETVEGQIYLPQVRSALCEYVCMCVCEGERESVRVCLCVCACV